MRLDEIVSTVATIISLLVIAFSSVGCASMEAGVFMRRHDTSTETRTATETNWSCLFVDCGKGGK